MKEHGNYIRISDALTLDEEDLRALASRNRDNFEFADEVNDFAQRFHVKTEYIRDPQNIGTLLFFSRIISSQRAVSDLCRQGLTHDATTILRAMLECVCVIGAIHKDPGFFKRYIESDQLSRIATGKVLRKHCKTENDRTKIDQKLKELKEEHQKKKYRKFTLREIADIGDMGSLYDTVYRFLSTYAHPTPRSLDRNLEETSDHLVATLRPSIDSISQILWTSAVLVIQAFHVTVEILLPNGKERDELLAEKSERFDDRILKLMGNQVP